MAALKPIHKIFIIHQLAMWTTPSDIVKLLEAEFKIKATLSQVCYYDPKYGKISKELKTLFEETRENFLNEITAIPIANEAYRIQVLQNRLNAQLSARVVNDKLVMELCEQVAKERGKMYTNRREITGANGKPLFENPLAMAQGLLKEFIDKGWEPSEAVQFAAERYKVNPADLMTVSEANN